MRQIKFLLLLVLIALNVATANAAVKGDKFTKDGMTYVITIWYTSRSPLLAQTIVGL